MSKLTLDNIQGQFASTTELNDNFDKIETALENTVSRDGTSPNTMSADLDLNSNNINNAETVNATAVIVNGVSIVGGDTLTVPGASSVPNTPTGNIVATDVQAAVDELDAEKVGLAGTETITGDKTLSGTNTHSGVNIFSNDNTHSGDNTFSGSNTHSGLETFDASVIFEKGPDVDSDAISEGELFVGFAGNSFDVYGTTEITSIDTLGIGSWMILQFDDVLNFAHSSIRLILPGGADITTAPGDIALMYEFAEGEWRCVSYTKASGRAIVPTAFRGCLAYNSASQSIPNATNTEILFNSESYDTDSIHNVAVNHQRLVVPSGVTRVKLTGQVAFTANGTGVRNCWIMKGGAATYVGAGQDYWEGFSTTQNHGRLNTPVITVSGGDIFTLVVYQTSGGSLNVGGSAAGNNTWFAMEIIE